MIVTATVVEMMIYKSRRRQMLLLPSAEAIISKQMNSTIDISGNFHKKESQNAT